VAGVAFVWLQVTADDSMVRLYGDGTESVSRRDNKMGVRRRHPDRKRRSPGKLDGTVNFEGDGKEVENLTDTAMGQASEDI